MPKRLPPWTKIECSDCGEPYQATRTEPADYPEHPRCPDCDLFNRGYEIGEKNGRELEARRSPGKVPVPKPCVHCRSVKMSIVVRPDTDPDPDTQIHIHCNCGRGVHGADLDRTLELWDLRVSQDLEAAIASATSRWKKG